MLWLTLDFPELRHCARSPRPSSELAQLACWAGRFTPQLSVGHGRLSLEVAASLRLFGGLPKLLQEVRADLAVMATPVNLAVAPTVLASCWLARGASEAICLDLPATRSALELIPLEVLELPAPLTRRLETFGVRRIGQLLALPRASLGQRLGAALGLDLARALGELPDPQPWFVFPERFDQRLELPAPVEAAPVLLFAARRLIAALCGWLAARNSAVRTLTLEIDHGHEHVTALPLAFSAPVHVAARIERVLKERLELLVLPAPALSLRLQADGHELRDAGSQVLFDGGGGGQDVLAELFDRLTARLGETAVQRVACHADYRPEAASRFHSVKEDAGHSGQKIGAGDTANMLPRPLWLIDPPEALREVQGQPSRGGRLQLLAGPERIEAGWWDGADARRDYFIAMDTGQRWCWIFRDPRPPGGWYLHGWFA
jgi:protein ImuB